MRERSSTIKEGDHSWVWDNEKKCWKLTRNKKRVYDRERYLRLRGKK